MKDQDQPAEAWRLDPTSERELEELNRLSFHEYHDRFAAATRKHGGNVRRLSHGGCVATFGDPRRSRFAVLSGLHGDERSGPVALLHGLEQVRGWAATAKEFEFWVAPLVNDAGWDENTRNWHSLNLNRSFLPELAPPFLNELMADLSTRVPSLYFDLHEDSEKSFAYVYRYTEDRHDLAERLERLLEAKDVPWSPEELERWKGASEVFVRRLGCNRCATLETPPAWALGQRVAWYLRALEYGSCYFNELVRS
jgi:predicted deacylase